MRAYSVKDVGVVVRQRRAALGMTQRNLSEKSGCGVRFISDLENGKETIEFGRALRLMNMLGIDVLIETREF